LKCVTSGGSIFSSVFPAVPPATPFEGVLSFPYRLSQRYASMAMPSAFSSPRLSKSRYPSVVSLVTCFGLMRIVRTKSPASGACETRARASIVQFSVVGAHIWSSLFPLSTWGSRCRLFINQLFFEQSTTPNSHRGGCVSGPDDDLGKRLESPRAKALLRPGSDERSRPPSLIFLRTLRSQSQRSAGIDSRFRTPAFCQKPGLLHGAPGETTRVASLQERAVAADIVADMHWESNLIKIARRVQRRLRPTF
jgi:hypothetical protein